MKETEKPEGEKLEADPRITLCAPTEQILKIQNSKFLNIKKIQNGSQICLKCKIVKLLEDNIEKKNRGDF